MNRKTNNLMLIECPFCGSLRGRILDIFWNYLCFPAEYFPLNARCRDFACVCMTCQENFILVDTIPEAIP